MQRTIRKTRFTYAVNKLNEGGGAETELRSITINEVNQGRALKLAFKQVGMFQPLKIEKVEELYYMSEETFIKNAECLGEIKVNE